MEKATNLFSYKPNNWDVCITVQTHFDVEKLKEEVDSHKFRTGHCSHFKKLMPYAS